MNPSFFLVVNTNNLVPIKLIPTLTIVIKSLLISSGIPHLLYRTVNRKDVRDKVIKFTITNEITSRLLLFLFLKRPFTIHDITV